MRAVPGVHNAVAFRPCFGLYPTQAKMAGVELRQAPLNPDFSFNFDGLLKLVDENTTLVIITSPDNPSGRVASPDDLEALARALPPACLLVWTKPTSNSPVPSIPCCRGSTACPTWLSCAPSPRCTDTRSRVGYAILPPAIADYMWRVRLPFSLNILAEEAALAALADESFRERTEELVKRGRARLTRELRAMGCDVTPSLSNFIMFRLPEGSMDAKALHGELLKRGVIIRALGSYHLPDRLRVSVGTDEENELFLSLMHDILGV